MTYEIPDETAPAPARAWVYAGEWVADCPRPPDPITKKGCGGVEFLYQPQRPNGPRTLRKPIFMCSNCGWQAVIDWPANEHAIMQVLARRPLPQSRNWFPADHPLAVNSRIPHGQSVQDLEDENESHGVR
jgi:hypothetical protein